MVLETPAPVLRTLQTMGPLLQGRVILVMGASRGIGAGISSGLARAGATLALASRDMDASNQVADAIAQFAERPMVLHCDIADAASVKACVAAVVKRHGRLDGAVNNAGRSHPGALLGELDESVYDGVMDVIVRGTFLAMKAEIAEMMKCGGGAIVNVASTGSIVGVATKSLYIAAKHAIAGMTRTAGIEYADKGIRINAIAPGATFTDMVANGLGATEEGRKKLVGSVPMARMATIDEMAGPAIWLLSDLASYVTATIVPIDGGLTAS